MSAGETDTPRKQWRALEELLGAADAFEQREPAPYELEAWDSPQRREFMKLLGGSLSLLGLGACTKQPKETILPYAQSPERLIPGEPLYFATAMPWPSGALGLLVESHMGRPTKVEGNPEHPASRGATDVFAQASVLTLYDPARSQTTSRAGRIGAFETFERELAGALDEQLPRGGQGLRILTGAVTSPTLHALLRETLARFPKAHWIQYEPAHRDHARAGALLAFGQDVVPQHHFERAHAILALGADFLAGPTGVAAARALVEARAGGARLYVAESGVSITGSRADHRIAVRPDELAVLAAAVAHELGVDAQVPPHEARLQKWAETAAADLLEHRGSSLVLAGGEQPAEIHALAHAINAALGNVGNTLEYTEPVELEPSDHASSIAALVEDMRAGAVELLVVLGGNPCYDAPADVRFTEAMQSVAHRVHVGLYVDETAAQCHWHSPEAHYLESWGDARAADGTVSIVQPLIAPLYGARSLIEIAALLAGKSGQAGYDLLREHWRAQLGAAEEFERNWRRALHDGLVAGTAFEPKRVRLRARAIDVVPIAAQGSHLMALFRTDAGTHDGRFAPNAWLQECPRPLTKLTWDNAALIGLATARELGLSDGDVVKLTLDGRSVGAPAMIAPGHAEGCVTLPLGYGRSAAGPVGTDVGFNAFALRTAIASWQAAGLTLERTGQRHLLATTQIHHTMEGRDIVRTLRSGESAGQEAHGASEAEHGNTSLYPPVAYPGAAWGMAIDLDACIGCNACVVACQAENNIPVVGKEQVARGREMHWIRVDRYYEGDPASEHGEDLRIHFQPLPCMQCENAPCEVVCPVGATAHSDEGLNDMVYNRCVGTRYCSNNCPYKVRRFNFLRYTDFETESLKLQRNPDVTVRSRGVMEKCTYCVQRISAARIRARREDRPVRDGEVVTACQSVCPAQAITFGDTHDAASAVAARKAEPRNYGLLTELNTRPRTTYLARIERANPGLVLPRRPEHEERGG
jgi:Fe-S-cluster-containing dehydrogenase component/anaerobic selenocysteine-containing dehydrogenase